MTATATSARPTPQDVFAIVRDAVAVVCERAPDSVDATSVLDDLGADSLARVELAEIVEGALASYLPGLHIPDDDLGAFGTVGDAVDYLMARL
jgi:acyl carrier protein